MKRALEFLRKLVGQAREARFGVAPASLIKPPKAALLRLEPSTWILAAAILLRFDVVLRFDVMMGYDAIAHMRYTELLGTGEVPRVGVDTWAAHHPPLYYLLALGLEKLGLGKSGGKWISLAFGLGRLILADRIFRKLEPALPRWTRPLANAIHGFVPVGIRMDAFYSPESMAATLCLAAVWAASSRLHVIGIGVLLAAALLSKSTAIVAIPAVCYLLTLGRDGGKITRAGLVRAGGVLSIAGWLTMIWAFGNIQKYGTPFPNAYLTQGDAEWSLPLFKRHQASYYFPRLALSEVEFPYYATLPLSAPNVFVFDAWGDYYNFLNRGLAHYKPVPEAANGRQLGLPRLIIHRIFAVYGILFTVLLLAGAFDATRRLLKRQMPPEEVGLAILGAGYLFIMSWYAIWVPHEYDGPAKAAYGLGASAILSLWSARLLARLAERKVLWQRAVLAFAALPALLDLLLRIFW